MSNMAKNVDVRTFQNLCGAITPEPTIQSSWLLMLFAHLSTHFEAGLSDFRIRLLQIRPNLNRDTVLPSNLSQLL